MTNTLDTPDPQPTPLRTVVVDLETTGFDPADGHFAVSAAWWDLDQARRGAFITRHTWADVAKVADPAALRVNRYLDTIHGQPQDTGIHDGARSLWSALTGAVLAGSNPSFDWRHMPSVFRAMARSDAGRFGWARLDETARRELCEPDLATHRHIDLANYAAGRLGLPTDAKLPGLRDVCVLLGVDAPDHTAVGDVTSAGGCLLRLRDDDWVAAYSEWRTAEPERESAVAAWAADVEVPGPAAQHAAATEAGA